MAFSQREKRAHYNAVARGEKPVKDPSKFPEQSQKDYARGQADARNEAAAIYMYNKSTQQQREEFKTRKAEQLQASYTSKCKACGKPCSDKYSTCYACYKATKVAVPKASSPAEKPQKKGDKKSEPKKDSIFAKYKQLKAKHKGEIIFLRLGDFYEVLGKDAKTVSEELSLTLTTRNEGVERVPMCGVPCHSANSYVERLTQKGYKVALID